MKKPDPLRAVMKVSFFDSFFKNLILNERTIHDFIAAVEGSYIIN